MRIEPRDAHGSSRGKGSCLRRGCLVLTLGLAFLALLPLVWREVELSLPNVKKSPSGKQYAQVSDDGTIRVYHLPCDNILSPPPCVDVTGIIESFAWQGETLVVDVAKGGLVTNNDCGVDGYRVIVRVGGKVVEAPSRKWKY